MFNLGIPRSKPYPPTFGTFRLANEFVINNEDRVAQMILMPVKKMELEEVENLPDSLRGKGGFGSTGK